MAMNQDAWVEAIQVVEVVEVEVLAETVMEVVGC